jgi:tetratricopeptide (TPR) repeat protein
MSVRLPRQLLAAAAVALVAVALGATRSSATQRTYGLDEDPIRRGTKALAESRWSDARARFDEAVAADYKTDQAKYGLAEIAVKEGHPDQAEALYREALAVRFASGKEYPEASAGLGLLLFRAGRRDEAGRELDRAAAARPDLWDALYGQARLLLDAGKREEAKALLAKGADKRGVAEGEDRYHYGMALLHLAEGDLDGAERDALIALHLDATDPEHGALVAQVYEKRNAPTLAIDAYEQALAAPGMTPTAPMLDGLGRLYQRVQRYTDARDRFVRALEVDSTYAPALRDLADVYRLAKQHEKAARIYLRYLLARPDDVDARVRLAESYLELGQFAPAAEAAKAATARDSTRTDVRFALARAGLRSTDSAMRAEAAAAFLALPDTLPWKAEDLVALAGFQAESKQTDDARRSLDRALALAPDLADAHYQRGLLDLSAGRPDSAVASLEKAAQESPDSPLYHLNLGIAYYQAKRVGDSIPEFRRAVELKPELTSGRMLLAQALAVSDSVSAAAAEYRAVLDVEPANAKALRGLGFCRIRSADYRAAAKAYEAAVKAEPANADGWAGLGNAYLGLQDWDAAQKAFERARAIDPANSTMKKGMELLSQARRGAAGK